MLKGSFSLCLLGSWKASQPVKAMGFSTGRQDSTITLLTIQTIACISALVFLQQKIRLDWVNATTSKEKNRLRREGLMLVSKQLTQILPDITLYSHMCCHHHGTACESPTPNSPAHEGTRRGTWALLSPCGSQGPFHCTAGQGCSTASHPQLQRALPHLILKRIPFLFLEFIILVLSNSNPDIHLIQLIHSLSTPGNYFSSTEQQ